MEGLDAKAWTVSEGEAPRGWLIEGEGGGGGHARLTCTLRPNGGGRRFERVVCRMPSAWLARLDLLLVCRRMTAGSEEALRRLKAVMETNRPSRAAVH